MELIDTSPAPEQDASVTASPDSQSLRRNALGTGGIVFMVISAAAPLTIIAGVAPLAILIGGVSAPLAYTVAGIILGIFAIAFMAMTRYVKALGGFYTYITQSLGKAVGLGSSFVALVSYNALQIGLYGLMGTQGHEMLKNEFGIDVPWWVIAGIGIAAVFLVAWRGIDVGAKVLGVLLALEALILVVLAVVILAQGGADGITFGTFDAGNLFNPGMFAILGVGFAAFMGFESTALYREEARDPEKTIPRATYISVIFMAVFYGFILWAIIIGLGESQAVAAAGENPAGLVFAEAGHYLGAWAELVMYLLILTSVYASQLAFHNAINRYTFSLARDGVLPKALHRVDAATGSPVVSGLVQTVLAVIVVGAFAVFGLDPYLQLLLWVNSPGVIGIIALQVLTCVAVVVFFVRNRELARKWYVIPAAIVSGVLQLGILYVLCSSFDLLTAAGPAVNAILIAITPVTFLVGIVLALVWKRTRPDVYARIGGASEFAEATR
ncbi:APC family permease [Leifsonia sp. Leaf264]|uniref:APC family permease n=1 Tax=Leifsonia sp. Leaf264 TaxID=1736314 RepID=UPI00070192FB|nr:APC family permease [Leifsonia sp. Leaf264]KQO96795.1 amino acid transporter [Leifsonia sp. Leaf264]